MSTSLEKAELFSKVTASISYLPAVYKYSDRVAHTLSTGRCRFTHVPATSSAVHSPVHLSPCWAHFISVWCSRLHSSSGKSLVKSSLLLCICRYYPLKAFLHPHSWKVFLLEANSYYFAGLLNSIQLSSDSHACCCKVCRESNCGLL